MGIRIRKETEKIMKDLEFAKNIEDTMFYSRRHPERLNAMLDLKLLDCSRAEMWAEYEFEAGEWCRNPYGGVHGGIICSIIDTGMGFTCATYSNKYVSTTDLSVSYLKPMMGAKYIVRVDLTQAGSRMIRCLARVTDAESGILCATGMGSFITAGDREKGARV